MNKPMSSFSGTFLIYDGDCPLCTDYVQSTKIREKIPDLQFVSARDVDDARVKHAWDIGINLNEEMALYYENSWYTGPEAMLKLGATGTPGVLDRLIHTYLGGADVRRKRYGFLVSFRKILLRMLSRQEIRR